MDTLLAVDTSYLYFRAFYGVPTSLKTPAGQPVNAIRGFLDALARLLETYRPQQLACAWDEDWRPAWRVELLPEYKAHRLTSESDEEVPDELLPQVPIIRECLTALGIPAIGHPGFEADDVLGSLSTQHHGSTVVVTGDRDLFQLIDDRTKVAYVARGVADHPLLTEDWLLTKLGITPERYVAFAALRGDPSDGLPGVSGIGEKTAARLLSDFSGVAEILAAAKEASEKIRPAIRNKLLCSEDYLRRAEQVVTVTRDLTLPQPSQLPSIQDTSRVNELRERFGLGGSLERIAAALS